MTSKLSKVRRFYEKEYKKLLIIPFIIIILALVQIFAQVAITGDFVNKGVGLKGGSSIFIPESFSEDEIKTLQDSLNEKFPAGDLNVRSLTSAGKVIGISVDSDAQENEEINLVTTSIQEFTSIGKENYSIEITGSSLGDSFFKQTIIALLVSFILMGIVVIFYFRSIVPALAVILAAASDIIVTLAIFNLTGVKLNTAGIASFLMLIGYSVDTNILLNTRMLKKKGLTIMERIYSAMGTGLTMSATTLSVVLVTLIFVKSEIVKQIMIILFIGLIVDLIMTWIQNVGILRLHLEKKHKSGKK